MASPPELDEWIAKLRELERSAVPEIAKEMAPALALELREQIRRGEGPDGQVWEPNQDGSQPLRTADLSGLTVEAHGTAVLAKLEGFLARHHLGRARGGVVRQILPRGAVTEPVARVLRAVFTRYLSSKLTG